MDKYYEKESGPTKPNPILRPKGIDKAIKDMKKEAKHAIVDTNPNCLLIQPSDKERKDISDFAKEHKISEEQAVIQMLNLLHQYETLIGRQELQEAVYDFGATMEHEANERADR